MNERKIFCITADGLIRVYYKFSVRIHEEITRRFAKCIVDCEETIQARRKTLLTQKESCNPTPENHDVRYVHSYQYYF